MGMQLGSGVPSLYPFPRSCSQLLCAQDQAGEGLHWGGVGDPSCSQYPLDHLGTPPGCTPEFSAPLGGVWGELKGGGLELQ